MGRILVAAAAVVVVVLLVCSSCAVQGKETDDVKKSLVEFLATLAGGGTGGQAMAQALGWDASIDPCPGVSGNGNASNWGTQVVCFNNGDTNAGKIKVIDLKSQKLNGTIDASLPGLCAAPALRVVNLQNNSLSGDLPAGVLACSGLTHLYVDRNRLSGSLPSSLGQFRKLLVLDVSSNNFSGELPASLSQITGLKRFMANDNHFEGTIPEFNLPNLLSFNVSSNNLTGPIPEHLGTFGSSSFADNAAGMCGKPLFPECPPSPSSGESKSRKTRTILMYLGYVLLGSVIVGFVVYKLCSRKKNNRLGKKARGGGKDTFDSSSDPTMTITTTASKSAYSLPASAERSATGAGGAPSTSLVVLKRSGTASVTSAAAAAAAKDLRFEDLLKSPAELLGRGRYGSSYKVVVPGGAALAVKRVKDATVTDDEFRRRMERVARARHPAVLPPLAFYCAAQEKLVVYEFQSNGSLHKLLHGWSMAPVRKLGCSRSLLGREIKSVDAFSGAGGSTLQPSAPAVAVAPPAAVTGPSVAAARITPAVLFITVVLAVVLLVSGMLHILRRLFIKTHRANARAEAVERQLQQLFHLHEDGAGPGLDQAAIDALPAFAYAELSGTAGAKGGRQFDCAVCLCEFAGDDRLRLLPLCGHAFHVACIDTWLASSSTCPLCRAALSVRALATVGAAAADSASVEPADIEEQKQEDAPPKEEAVVLPVRLGRFKNVQGGAAVHGDTGTSSRLDGRRCFSMASSYQYVLADDNLVVSVHWRPGDGSAAMSPGVTTASGDEQGKKVCAASRGDSFSVSKIWQWRRSGERRLPGLRAGSSSPTDDALPWASPASTRSARQEIDS